MANGVYKFFTFLLTIVGLNPYITFNKRSKLHLKQHSLFNILTTITVIILLIFCAVSFKYRDEDINTFSYSYNILQWLLNFISHTISVLCAIVMTSHLRNILNNFNLIDHELTNFLPNETNIFNQFKFKLNVFYSVCNFWSISFLLSLVFLTQQDNVQRNSIWLILNLIGFILPKFALTLLIFHYCGLVLIIYYRLQLINNQILIGHNQELDPIHRNIFQMFNKQFQNHSESSSTNRPLLFFQSISNIVTQLQTNCKLINEYFGKTMTLYFLSSITTLILQSNYILDHIQESGGEMISMLCATMITEHAIEIILILLIGTKVKLEWHKCYYNMVLETTENYDTIVVEFIEHIVRAMQLNPIAFNAESLFELDLSILTSMVTMFATLVVVVIQMRLAYNDATNDAMKQVKFESNIDNDTKSYSVRTTVSHRVIEAETTTLPLSTTETN